MSAPVRESKWLILAMLAVVGFGVLVLTVGSIDQRMAFLHREQRSDFRQSPDSSSSALPEASSYRPRESNHDQDEEINESDSLEERIRKKYGMVKLAGVWLPAMPVKSATAAGTTAGLHGPDGGAAYAVPLYITTGRLPEGRAGERYQFRIEAVGGVPPYAWGIERGVLAGSIKLGQTSGELSGTPADASTTTVRVRVTRRDWRGGYRRVQTARHHHACHALATSMIAPDIVTTAQQLATPPQSPVEQGGETRTPDANGEEPGTKTESDSKPAQLVITSRALDDARVGEGYAAQLMAAGGSPPYAWSSIGQLPSGFSLTTAGVLSGLPRTPGEFILNLSVMDQAAQGATLGFALMITPAVPDPVSHFTAFISLRKVALSWANSADPSVTAVRIVRNVLNPPAHQFDGTIVYEGPNTSALHPSPPSGGSYYAAFALNADATASRPAHLAVALKANIDPFADAVIDRNLLHAQAYNAVLLPGIVLGSPKGGGIGSGSLDVVSLGAASVDEPGGAPYGGSIVISFENNLAYDGPGADITIFENVFYIKGATGYDPNSRMMEPAIVSVSQDGVVWHTFPFDFSPRYDAKTGALNLRHPFVYNKGFAGVNPVIANGYNVDPTDPAVSGGDSFDLADLHVPGLTWIRYVRIQSTGEKWLVDSDGDLVRHSNTSALKEASRSSPTSGFDLDAVTAIWLDAVQ